MLYTLYTIYILYILYTTLYVPLYTAHYMHYTLHALQLKERRKKVPFNEKQLFLFAWESSVVEVEACIFTEVISYVPPSVVVASILKVYQSNRIVLAVVDTIHRLCIVVAKYN